MQLTAAEVSDLIKKKIESFDVGVEARTEGTIVTLTDGIAAHPRTQSDVMQGEMIEFPGNTFGLALNLERDSVGAVIMGDYGHISEGDTVKCTGRILEVPVGRALLGRVVNSLGEPIDGKGPVEAEATSPIEKVAPGVITRQSVSPAGADRSQVHRRHGADRSWPARADHRRPPDRQDRGGASTRSSTRRAAIIKCIYVAIGQKASSIAGVVRKLEEHGAMDHTIVVAASRLRVRGPAVHRSLRRAALWASFSATVGEDALIIYDDLTKQAWAYRQVSLLLRRPPGREAYPGDVFYLHSRLLERAARVNAEAHREDHRWPGQGPAPGSLTALPIIETQAGDVSAFVPTNVISITDGQIFLETDLFNAGTSAPPSTPACRCRVSGGAAQTGIIKRARWRCAPGARSVSRAGGLLAVRFRPRRGDPQASWNAVSA